MKLVEEFADYVCMLDSDFFDPTHALDGIRKVFRIDFRVMEAKDDRVDIRRGGDIIPMPLHP